MGNFERAEGRWWWSQSRLRDDYRARLMGDATVLMMLCYSSHQSIHVMPSSALCFLKVRDLTRDRGSVG